MGKLERVLRAGAWLAVLGMLAIYYMHGPVLLVWPDSAGYLVQALGIDGAVPFARPGDRAVGYPLLLALALELPRPMLALVLFQAGLTIAAFAGVYRALVHVVLPRMELGAETARRAKPVMLAGVCASTLYSVVHVQIASMLTETLFAALALLAVLAMGWLLLPGRVARWPWLEAAVAAALGAAPMLVKPHWLIASVVLALLAGGWLARRSMTGLEAGHARRLATATMAFALPLLAAWGAGLPDRYLGERFSAREHALFGPRTAFCTHARLILATLKKRPGVSLQGDPTFEHDLHAELEQLVAEHRGGWGLLGYNADLCSYSAPLSALLDRQFPEPREQGRFLLTSLIRAARAEPLPYVNKVIVQLAAGFHTAFTRFAIDVRPGLAPYKSIASTTALPADFLAGVRLADEVAPLGSRNAIHNSLVGRTVQTVLAVYFFGLTGALVMLVLVSLTAPAWRWGMWPHGVRAYYLTFVAMPLAVLFGHHLLVALVHSFDIWRYGFNCYFVNLLFVGAAGMFWWADLARWRAAA